MGSQNPQYVRKLIKYYESKAKGSQETPPFWRRLFQFNTTTFQDDESDTEDLLETAVIKKESNTQTDDEIRPVTEKNIQFVGDVNFGKIEEKTDGWKNFFDFQNVLAILVIFISVLYIIHNRRLEMERNSKGIIAKAVEKLLECFRFVYSSINKKLEMFEI